MKTLSLSLRYAAFAILATIANLLTQRVVLASGNGPTLFVLAVGAGTIVGLGLKYILDKRWIFRDRSSGFGTNTRTFALYSVMGIATTAIFWGTETTFWLVWRTDLMRELGAVIGLSVGYVIKYKLDRRFVFRNAQLAQAT